MCVGKQGLIERLLISRGRLSHQAKVTKQTLIWEKLGNESFHRIINDGS